MNTLRVRKGEMDERLLSVLLEYLVREGKIESCLGGLSKGMRRSIKQVLWEIPTPDSASHASVDKLCGVAHVVLMESMRRWRTIVVRGALERGPEGPGVDWEGEVMEGGIRCRLRAKHRGLFFMRQSRR